MRLDWRLDSPDWLALNPPRMEKPEKLEPKKEWQKDKGQHRVLREYEGRYYPEGFYRVQAMRKRQDGRKMGQVGIHGGMVTCTVETWKINGEMEEIAVVKYLPRVFYTPLPLETKEHALMWRKYGFGAEWKPKQWASKMQWRGWESWHAASIVRRKWVALMNGTRVEGINEELAEVVQFPGQDEIPGPILGVKPSRLDGFRMELAEDMKRQSPSMIEIREMIRAEALAAVADAMESTAKGFEEARAKAMDAADRAEIAADLAKVLAETLDV